MFKNKHAVKKSGVNFDKQGIISLANSYPYIKKENISLTYSHDTFKLAFPGSEYVTTVNEDILFKNQTIESLGEMMGISDFKEMLSRHKKIVENEFKERSESGRAWFNNEKFGVRSVRLTKTDDTYEDNVLNLSYYKTDYFTHKVMRSIYHELRNQGHDIASFSCVEDIKFDKYYPFLTSFGIDSLLSVEDEKGRQQIFLAKRSKYMANMDADLWHVSMNEGLSITDMDVDDDSLISWDRCVERGYREELGVKKNFRIRKNEYGDLFMTRDNFEMGITTYAVANIPIDDLRVCYEGAEDSSMETTKFTLIANTSDEIRKFLKKENLTDVLRYCLTMKLSKMI